MSAAVFRLTSFVALAAVAGGLWVALFRSTGGTVTATPAIPSFSSQSVFAPASPPRSGLSVSGVVQNRACTGCTVHVGSGGLVRAQVPSGGGRRTAYALLDLAHRAAGGEVLVHDVIGFGRGQTPARRIALLQVLDVSHRLIFELVARPDRRLYLTSPTGGLRATPLVLATGAIVPNDGISGVAVDVALKTNGWLLVSVNGVRTAAVRRLAGARTGAPRFLAAGVIGYRAPPSAGAITATHAQVSVSTPPATVAQPSTQPTLQPVPPAPPVNSPPPLSLLSPPTISGTAIVGETLTAAPGTWSDGTATFTYVWESCDGTGSCTAIDGAEGRSYDLVRADRGAFVRVRVTAHVGDAVVSGTSGAVGPVTLAAPTSLRAPTISGAAVVGAELTVDPGSWSDPDATFTFAWQRCDESGVCVTIDGAAGESYDVTSDDLGSSLLVEVTASNSGGEGEADSLPTDVVVPPVPSVIAAPAVTGDMIVGSVLTADPGTWSDPAATFTYAWVRCHGNGRGSCTAIDGVDGKTYVLTGDDVGFRIGVIVTATNAGGSGSADSSLVGPVVAQAPPSVITAPSVSGDAIVGSVLTADPGTWSDPAATFAYAWLRCDAGGACATIDGASGTTYALTADDLGSSIGVEVTATGVGGNGTADSSLVGPVVAQAPPSVITAPAVTGDTIVGSVLTADPGTWSDPAATFTYAWLRCDAGGACATIDGASGTTYALTADDLGSSIGVEVTATGVGGNGTADSSLVGPVVAQAPPSVITAPAVTGDMIVGSVLTADPGTWSDPAATFTYAWVRCHGNGRGSCTAIDGVDGKTYVLTGDDVGFRIGVIVTATNAGGSGSADSSLVGPVVAQAPPSVITAPSVSGDAIVGSVLTADPGTWSDPAATFAYAWLRCDAGGACATIDGASGTTYALVTDDLHFLLRVEVTAANAAGTATALSTPTAPVESAAETSSAVDTTPPGTG